MNQPAPTYEPTQLAFISHLESGYHPLPGHCLLRLHKQDATTTSGLLTIPESARDLEVDDISGIATVLAMAPRRGWDTKAEGFDIGSTVITMLRLEDLSRMDGLLVTKNTCVYAVVEN